MKKAKKKGTPSAKTLRGRRSAPSKKAHLKGLHQLKADDLGYAKNVGLATFPAYEFDCFGVPKLHDVYWSRMLGGIRIAGIDFETEFPLFKPVPPPKSPKGRGK